MYSAALNPVLVNRVQLHVEYEHTAQILHRPAELWMGGAGGFQYETAVRFRLQKSDISPHNPGK